MSPYILVVSNKQHKKPISLYIQGDLMSGALVCSFDNGVFQKKCVQNGNSTFLPVFYQRINDETR